MDESDESDADEIRPPRNDALHEGMTIEGLRPPLTLEQRRRRLAISVLVVVGALVVLLWPAISSLQPSSIRIASLPQATVAPGSSWSSGSNVISGGVPVVAGVSTDNTACPVTTLAPSNGWNEMHPDTFGSGDVWALLLTNPPLRAGQDAMIVWRATGSGAFQVTASSASGPQLLPASGPDPHTGSNWQRPGEEWGTVFNFPRPGCWQLRVSRGANLTADLWLAVYS